jgi:hypothetical protein
MVAGSRLPGSLGLQTITDTRILSHYQPAGSLDLDRQIFPMSRRFQFSLKWLFVAMLVGAAFFGGINFERERRRRQDELPIVLGGHGVYPVDDLVIPVQHPKAD